MTIELTILVSVVSVAFAIYFGLKSNRRNDIKDIEERAARDAKINYKLDMIIDDNKLYKQEMVATNKRVEEIDRRVVVVEQATKSAHHRIDRLEGREDEKNAKRDQEGYI
jgi:hypothetical protein